MTAMASLLRRFGQTSTENGPRQTVHRLFGKSLRGTRYPCQTRDRRDLLQRSAPDHPASCRRSGVRAADEAPKSMGKRATQGLGPLSGRRAPPAPRLPGPRREAEDALRSQKRTRPGYCNGSTITSVSTRAAVSSLVAGLGPCPSAKARSSRRCPCNHPGRA